MAPNFEKRLERAIDRGRQSRSEKGRLAAAQAMTEEELRQLHSQSRLALSEHIEDCLRKLADHLPGFDFETVVNEDGWGARILRDDLSIGAGRQPRSLFSRLQLAIRPFGPARIVELTAKGTIQNREVLNRTHYQELTQLDRESFAQLIDQWVLEFAEKFVART